MWEMCQYYEAKAATCDLRGQVSFVRSVEALSQQHGDADIAVAFAQATRPQGHKK